VLKTYLVTFYYYYFPLNLEAQDVLGSFAEETTDEDSTDEPNDPKSGLSLECGDCLASVGQVIEQIR